MRKVNSGLFITLDGVTESPDQWQFDSFDDDMMATMTAHIAAEDTILLGRVTYQDWTHYWPMAQTFMRLGLIDEYRINVNPVVLGRGVPLFAGLKTRSSCGSYTRGRMHQGWLDCTIRRAEEAAVHAQQDRLAAWLPINRCSM